MVNVTPNPPALTPLETSGFHNTVTTDQGRSMKCIMREDKQDGTVHMTRSAIQEGHVLVLQLSNVCGNWSRLERRDS